MARRSLEDTLELGKTRKLIEITDNKIKYIIQDKEYILEPEEYIRAAVYIELVEDYLYSPYNIDFEIAVPRRTPTDFADIVIFSNANREDNYIIIENKRKDCSREEYLQAIEQGFGNANSMRGKFLIIDNYTQRNVYDVANFPANERESNKLADIAKNYGLIPTYRLKRGGENDLRRVSFSELASIFKKCHNILWGGGN